jgi:hypothetical protein
MNDEARTSNEIANSKQQAGTNLKGAGDALLTRRSSLIRHSSFAIRQHSERRKCH